VIGLVAPVGADLGHIAGNLCDNLKRGGYVPVEVRVSNDIISKISRLDRDGMKEAQAIAAFRDAGDEIRRSAGDSAILADGVAREISARRKGETNVRHAFIINSLKHPEEVRRLRRIYGGGFYLIAVSPDDAIRNAFLKRKGVADDELLSLIAKDYDEAASHGQRVSDAFHLADFFVRVDGHEPRLQGELLRVCRILFGDPFATPRFDEYAMFLAFASSVRSADMSRQVGAVIARGNDIVATGANDCPSATGGLYWPNWVDELGRIGDRIGTRDYVAGGDQNRTHIQAIIEQIVTSGKEQGLDGTILEQVLQLSRLRDVTEYQRAVHAEMDALLSAARNGVTTRNAALYCTTFPCHNCAKHIIAAGINRVVFIEPYRKSKALELHKDAIALGPLDAKSTHESSALVLFEPFIGVGPRRFFDFFSTRLGTGREIDRKQYTQSWDLEAGSTLRVQMSPGSYLEMESEASRRFEAHLRGS
jgi:deoxycytidylate deaminase